MRKLMILIGILATGLSILSMPEKLSSANYLVTTDLPKQATVVPAPEITPIPAPIKKPVTKSVKPKTSPVAITKATALPAISIPQPSAPVSIVPETLSEPDPVEAAELNSTIQALETKYVVEITASLPSHQEFDFLSFSSLDKYDQHSEAELVKMVDQELSKYSPAFIASAGLENIYLTKNLKVSGYAMAAMPDAILDDALYFDIGPQYLLSDNGQYMRRVFHHELDHLIEYNKYGAYDSVDPTWLICNPATFIYGKGGISAYADGSFINSFHPLDGFITNYATLAVEEDKAELFSWLMTDRSAVTKLESTDANLTCKVNSLFASYASF